MSAVLAPSSLSARFAAAIDLLCRGIAASLPKRWDAAPLALPAWIRLRQLLARFAALVAAVEAGRLPAARRTAFAAARPRPAPPAIRLPGGSGWLLRLAPALETRLGRAQVESLLAAPELAALLATAPQAGRILRPLCHMLRIEPPPSLRLPRRPRGRPDPSGSTEAEAKGGEESQARAARPILPLWLTPPASPPLPVPDARFMTETDAGSGLRSKPSPALGDSASAQDRISGRLLANSGLPAEADAKWPR